MVAIIIVRWILYFWFTIENFQNNSCPKYNAHFLTLFAAINYFGYESRNAFGV